MVAPNYGKYISAILAPQSNFKLGKSQEGILQMDSGKV